MNDKFISILLALFLVVAGAAVGFSIGHKMGYDQAMRKDEELAERVQELRGRLGVPRELTRSWAADARRESRREWPKQGTGMEWTRITAQGDNVDGKYVVMQGAYGLEEEKEVWNRIRVDKKGRVICSKENITK